MRVKRIRDKLCKHVRFYGTHSNEVHPLKFWYIDLVKLDHKAPFNYWQVFKTYNWDVQGTTFWPTDSYLPHYKRLREFKDWLFIERL